MRHVKEGGQRRRISIPRHHETPQDPLSLIFSLITSFYFSCTNAQQQKYIFILIFFIIVFASPSPVYDELGWKMKSRFKHVIVITTAIITIIIIIVITIIIPTIITIIMMGVDDKWGLDWPRATDHSWIPFQSSCQSQPTHNSIINSLSFLGPGCFFRVFFSSIYNLQS